jgi:hypothetical protein
MQAFSAALGSGALPNLSKLFLTVSHVKVVAPRLHFF